MVRNRLLALFSLASSLALPLTAATYLPMSDADLAAGAPVIVRATAVSREVRLETISGEARPFTIVTFQRNETIRGEIGETFSVRLPGGRVGGSTWSIPGVPRFEMAGEVVLMLRRADGHPGEWHLTELGLSKFDILYDDGGRRFAVRPEFDPLEDLAVSKRDDVAAASRAKSSAPARDAESFLSALRAVGRGEAMPDVELAEPKGEIGRAHGLRRKWANIGGREPGDCDGDPCLFRWFWNTGAAPAVVKIVGTQTNLNSDDAAGCGTDSTCHVRNGVDGWHGIAAADVRVEGPAAAGNVTVHLDAASSQEDGGAAWSTPIGCSGGTIGLGGPGEVTGAAVTYRGDTTFYGPSSGSVSMRKSTCNTGYSARTFKTAVMHEIGHVLGLHHPNQMESIHSTTGPADWDVAVMRSSVAASKPEAPQPDDIQAMQYLYGTAAVGAAPAAGFTFSPAAPEAGSPVVFADASSNATGWEWDFGDASSGDANHSDNRNPSHTFSTPGTYTVRLYAGSLNGTGTATRSVVVAPGSAASACVASPTTLCLNSGRFKVTAAFRTSDGRSGNATGVGLTSDSGYLWFFNPANIEVIVKVLNACTQAPPRYWVFAAGLTNVEVTLQVTDTQTGGDPKTYVNPLGTPFAPIQDTGAFATCP